MVQSFYAKYFQNHRGTPHRLIADRIIQALMFSEIAEEKASKKAVAKSIARHQRETQKRRRIDAIRLEQDRVLGQTKPEQKRALGVAEMLAEMKKGNKYRAQVKALLLMIVRARERDPDARPDIRLFRETYLDNSNEQIRSYARAEAKIALAELIAENGSKEKK